MRFLDIAAWVYEELCANTPPVICHQVGLLSHAVAHRAIWVTKCWYAAMLEFGVEFLVWGQGKCAVPTAATYDRWVVNPSLHVTLLLLVQTVSIQHAIRPSYFHALRQQWLHLLVSLRLSSRLTCTQNLEDFRSVVNLSS